MRVETTTRTLFTYEELSEKAQERARDDYREHVYIEPEEIETEMLYSIADALKSPGFDTYGPSDFPGIDGLKITEWDLDRGRGGYLCTDFDSEAFDNLRDAFMDACQSIAAYEWMYSDECVEEMLTINDYEFDAEGRIA